MNILIPILCLCGCFIAEMAAGESDLNFTEERLKRKAQDDDGNGMVNVQIFANGKIMDYAYDPSQKCAPAVRKFQNLLHNGGKWTVAQGRNIERQNKKCIKIKELSKGRGNHNEVMVNVGLNGKTMGDVQMGPNGIQMPGLQMGPNGMKMPGLEMGPDGIKMPGLHMGRNGMVILNPFDWKKR